MRPKPAYLILAVLGTLVPYIHFFPWLREHGLDLPLFFHEIHASHVSEFFSADVFLSAATLLAFLIFERHRIRGRWWIPVLGLLTVGVSLALPLLLYLRESQKPGQA